MLTALVSTDVGPHPGWPRGVSAGAAVRVDHSRDRFRVPAGKGGEITLRHPAKRAIVVALAALSQYLRCRRLQDREARQRYSVCNATASVVAPE